MSCIYEADLGLTGYCRHTGCCCTSQFEVLCPLKKEASKKSIMSRNEMIQFIQNNNNVHISHQLFADYEFIYSASDGMVYDENGYVFEDWSGSDVWSGRNGVRLRNGGAWETGWFIKE